MSANTDKVQELQGVLANDLLPALKAAESTTVDVAGEAVEIPQQAQARLKQKVNSCVVTALVAQSHSGIRA